MGIRSALAVQAVSEDAAGGVMEHLNAGYLQLGLFALGNQTLMDRTGEHRDAVPA